MLGAATAYTVTYTNTGNVNLTSPSLVDTLPPGATFVSASVEALQLRKPGDLDAGQPGHPGHQVDADGDGDLPVPTLQRPVHPSPTPWPAPACRWGPRHPFAAGDRHRNAGGAGARRVGVEVAKRPVALGGPSPIR